MTDVLHYADLAAALARLGVSDEASAYHGALCGALCRQAPEALDPLSLLADGDPGDDAAGRATLSCLRDATARALADPRAALRRCCRKTMSRWTNAPVRSAP